MRTEIFSIPLGMCNCYLVKQEGTMFVDSGFPGQDAKFLKAMEKLAISPAEIRIIVLTHGHYDHIGSIAALKRITEGKVAIHHDEKDWVEQPRLMLPPAIGPWGKIWHILIKAMMKRMNFPGIEVDIAIEDDVFPLQSFGINGRVLHTPGHSPGSSSVVLDSGEAFIGDLAMNGLPMRLGSGMPIFAEDVEMVQTSWRKLLANENIHTVYPAHGKPFKAEILRKKLNKMLEA